MMSNISEEEISRRLALLPTVLQSLDHQVKVALVQNGCYETIRFPTTERSWERLAEKCGFDEGTLNLVRNLVNPPQSQQGGESTEEVELNELFNAFLNAEEKDGMIKLKDSKGNPLNFIIEQDDTLVIRKADRHLWTLFSRVVLDGVKVNPGDPDKYHGAVVLGPEGIGKSWCSMYFLIQAIKKGYTVVYESVHLEKSWVFSKDRSRVISNRKPNDQDEPELKSKRTLHIFDAKAGDNSYSVKRIVAGAKQIVFSSTNRTTYAQFIRDHDVFEALLPSTTKEEFDKYVTLFNVTKDIVDKVVEVSGFGKIRPLKNLSKHLERMNGALNNFDLNKLRNYANADNATPSGHANPAILLDAMSPDDLDTDEKDLNKIFSAYSFDTALWNFPTNFILERIINKYGTEADAMVEKLYFALGNDANRTLGPAIGGLFEHVAVKPDFIPKYGLFCESFEAIEGNHIEMTLGKGYAVEDCRSEKVTPLHEILQNCKDPKVIYQFVEKNEGFDAFIPPNNFIGFTHRLSKHKENNDNNDDINNGIDNNNCIESKDSNSIENHPISLDFALKSCELIKSQVNFITAVPAHQAGNWTQQSFKVNVQEVVDEMNRKIKNQNTATLFQKGGQRTFDKLPHNTQTKLKPFRQFLGSLVMKRKVCTTVRLNTSGLVRISILSAYKYFK